MNHRKKEKKRETRIFRFRVSLVFQAGMRERERERN